MKKTIFLLFGALLMAFSVVAQPETNLPKKLVSEYYRAGHVQGVAVDAKREYVYLSFTTMLVKMDMQGNVVGTVTGLLGHLGCIEFNEEDGRVYGSLEYKDDSIGKGILKREGVNKELEIGFYVAIFDVDKITRRDMSAERDGVMTSVLLKTVVEDYKAKVRVESGEKVEHRHGCSGFDGMSFGPSFDGSGKTMLTIAYGIYRDNNRSDNDYQVLLQYDTRKWAKYELPLSQYNMHRSGPVRPQGKYFVYTGNTSWGVQNLEYDKDGKRWFLACYPGRKPHFPNYTLFVVDGTKKAKRECLRGVSYERKGEVLQLINQGNSDNANPQIRGWHNKLGVYGIAALGNDYFYLVQAKKQKKIQGAIIHLARYVGTEEKAFELVE